MSCRRRNSSDVSLASPLAKREALAVVSGILLVGRFHAFAAFLLRAFLPARHTVATAAINPSSGARAKSKKDQDAYNSEGSPGTEIEGLSGRYVTGILSAMPI